MASGMLQLLQAASSSSDAKAAQLRPAEHLEEDIPEQFHAIWQDYAQGNAQKIPLFNPACIAGSLRDLVLQEARARNAQAQRQLWLEEPELELIGQLLLDHQLRDVQNIPLTDADGPRINYDGFAQAAARIKAELGLAVSPYFQPSTFLKFERDAMGSINLAHLMQFVGLHSGYVKLRAQLAEFDESGRGELGLPQLQRHLAAVAAAAPLLASMESYFLPHYVHIASRKLLLFHGRRSLQPSTAQPRQRGDASANGSSSSLVVRLADLASSTVMQELQEVLLLGPGAEMDRDLFSNWFTPQSTQRVLSTFTNWDLDGNGSLSRQEFSAISQGAMTDLFISRVFEEHVAPQRGAAWPPQQHQQQQQQQQQAGSPRVASPGRLGGLPSIGGGRSGTSPPRLHSPTKGNSAAGRCCWPPPLPPGAAGPRDEMDLLAFADFVLAWDHRNHPVAVPYFFQIFDIHKRGYLTLSDLYTFFREVKELWVAMGEYKDLDIYDVLDEVMDMVGPACPGRITKADLEASKMAGVLFGLLANVEQFYQYNFRENFMHQEGEGDAAAAPA